MKDPHKETDLLLARGQLSGAALERILDQTLARVAPRRRRWLPVTLGILAAAALLLFITLPDGFHARGGGGGPLLEASCKSGGRESCKSGELLFFRVDGARSGGWLAAWAEPVTGGERVWYFPSADGALLEVAAQPGPQLLPYGAELGTEQPPGVYRLHLVLLAAPLPRDAIAAAHPLAQSQQRLEVQR